MGSQARSRSQCTIPAIDLGVKQSAPDLGDKWSFWGDSHNFGYGSGACRTPGHAIANIWQTRFPQNGPNLPYTNFGSSNIYQDGVSGRSLAGTRAEYDDWDGRTTCTFMSLQESGSQGAGQTNPTEYGNTLSSFIDAAIANALSSYILLRMVIETSFNFHRGVGEEFETEGREWGGYNIVARSVIASKNKPNQIFICETDRDIKLLENSIGQVNVWLQPNEANPYHFKSPGNLMIALGHYKAIGIHDISLSDLSGIDDGIVSPEYKQECLNVYKLN